MAIMYIKRGDTAPSLQSTLTDNGETLDLTSATAIRVIGAQGGAVLFDRTAAGDDSGVVTMPWDAADTATIGVIFVEWEVTWPNGTIQTFPAGGYQRVSVTRDLG